MVNVPKKASNNFSVAEQVGSKGCLSISTVKRAPKFSFGSGRKNYSKTDGPGPGQYNPGEADKVGKDGPKFSMAKARHEKKDQGYDTTPGPGAYSDVNKNPRLKNAPKYGLRL